MKCAWNELLAILPQWMRTEVDKFGKCDAQELRLRCGRQPELVTSRRIQLLHGTVNEEELRSLVNAAGKYSPWAASTASKGYLTLDGGHRVGLCGEVYGDGSRTLGIRNVTSVNIRIARDFDGQIDRDPGGNILILGPPGSGKTTLLRSLCRLIAEYETVTVVDERGEIFPKGFLTGKRMDVLTGCGKAEGIAMALRTMGPSCIAVDEITENSDCAGLQTALWCGVRLIATVHASGIEDLRNRKSSRDIVQSGLFSTLLILERDKQWRAEKMEIAV